MSRRFPNSGSADYVSTGTIGETYNPGTWVMWIRINELAHDLIPRIMDYGEAAGGMYIALHNKTVYSNSDMLLRRNTGTPATGAAATPVNFGLTTNKWYFLCVTTDDGDSQYIRGFLGDLDSPPVEGTYTDAPSGSSGSFYAASAPIVRIGNRSSSPDAANGARVDIAQFAAFDGVRATVAQLQQLWDMPDQLWHINGTLPSLRYNLGPTYNNLALRGVDNLSATGSPTLQSDPPTAFRRQTIRPTLLVPPPAAATSKPFYYSIYRRRVA